MPLATGRGRMDRWTRAWRNNSILHSARFIHTFSCLVAPLGTVHTVRTWQKFDAAIASRFVFPIASSIYC